MSDRPTDGHAHRWDGPWWCSICANLARIVEKIKETSWREALSPA